MSKRLILADKNEYFLDALKVYLSRKGHDVLTVQSFQDLISAVEHNSSFIILTGTNMKDMNGIGVLKKLKELFSDIEIVMIVEEGDMHTGIQSLDLGASDYLAKPVSSEALDIVIRRARKRRADGFKIKRYAERLEALHTTNVLFQQLFAEVPCYISLQDKNFRLTGANRLFKKDFGDNIGSYCYEIYKHRTEPCIDCPVKATFEDGESHRTEEVVTSLSGEHYNVITWTSPIKDASGEITQVMEMATNITPIRKLQDHLTSLGLMIGSLAHSIRGMLTSIDGGIYRLESGIKKDDKEKIKDACEVIKKSFNRIRSMVVDMLSYTKKRELNCSHVNISDFTDEIVSVFKPKAVKQHVEFICEFDVSIIFFEIDPAALRSALINFLENAIDACEDDKNENKKHKIIFNVRENKNNIFFEIKDNGIGMDREIKDNMFTLFFSSKGHKGTGLGLFIANQTVEQHGGSIQVKSSLGKGSCFTLTLPKLLSKPK